MDGTPHSANEGDAHCRILHAALAEFTQCGYKGSSTRVIAERAGVNEVTLFRHFSSKSELLRAAVEKAIASLRVPADLEVYLALSFRDGLQRFASDYLMQISRNSDVIMLGFAESFSHPQIVIVLRGFMAKVRTALTQYFERLHEQGRMRQADFPVLTQMALMLLHGTPTIRKRAPDDEITQHLTDERVIAVIVDTIIAAYSLE